MVLKDAAVELVGTAVGYGERLDGACPATLAGRGFARLHGELLDVLDAKANRIPGSVVRLEPIRRRIDAIHAGLERGLRHTIEGAGAVDAGGRVPGGKLLQLKQAAPGNRQVIHFVEIDRGGESVRAKPRSPGPKRRKHPPPG